MRGGGIRGQGNGGAQLAGTEVTSSAVIADNAIVKGDGGARGIQGEPDATLSDAGLITVADGGGFGFQSQPTTRIETVNGNQLIIDALGSQVARFDTSDITFNERIIPASGVLDVGTVASSWQTVNAGGLRRSAVESAAAQYTADAGDWFIRLTAATAELVLPSIATVGEGFCLLIVFTGATSRTVTPDGTDTVEVANPAQDGLYLCLAVGTQWNMPQIA